MSETFTRNDLAEELSQRLALPVDRCKGIVDSAILALTNALASHKKVEFRGFGAFDVVQRKSKVGRNPKKPQDGQYCIPAHKSVRLRIGKDLFNKLNPEL